MWISIAGIWITCILMWIPFVKDDNAIYITVAIAWALFFGLFWVFKHKAKHSSNRRPVANQYSPGMPGHIKRRTDALKIKKRKNSLKKKLEKGIDDKPSMWK
jgi:hypothetical protein